MPPDRIPHVKRVVAKSGKVYRFFNTGKKDPRGNVIYAPLPDIADDGFWPRYTALKGGRTKRANAEAVITVPRLIDLYRKAPKYRSLEPNSKRLYDSGLNYAAKVFSIMPADMIEATDVEEYRDAIADTPSMANAFVRTVGALYAWAIPKYAKVNPASGIDELPTGEHEPWPVDLLHRALTCDDDTVRLAVHMLYYTTQRIGDVRNQARWVDLRGASWTMTPQKTRKTYGVTVIPLHKALKAELARHKPTGPMLFNMSVGTMRKCIKAWLVEQGRGDLVPHGLRKNGVIALLECGCSIAEVAAISRQSLAMVEYYARLRDQVELGGAAILRWEAKA